MGWPWKTYSEYWPWLTWFYSVLVKVWQICCLFQKLQPLPICRRSPSSKALREAQQEMHLKSLNALRWENPPANLDDSMVPTMENSLYKWGMSHGHWGMFAGNFLGIFQHFESIRIKVSWIHGDVTIRSGGFVPGSQGNAEKNVFFFAWEMRL